MFEKMFKFIVFLFFVCFLLPVNSLKLTPLCNERVTSSGDKVNSYYRFKFKRTLFPIGYYLLNATRDHFEASEYYSNSLYPEFNEQIREIYSEEFMNSSQLKEKITKKEKWLQSFKKRVKLYYNLPWLPDPFQRNFNKIKDLLLDVKRLNENNLTQSFLPYDELGSLLGLANAGLNENQSSLFRDKFIYVFYEKQLATLDGFKMQRGHKKIYLDESSFGEFSSFLFVPFFDRNYSQNGKSNCTSTDKLPKFYTHETVPTKKA